MSQSRMCGVTPHTCHPPPPLRDVDSAENRKRVRSASSRLTTGLVSYSSENNDQRVGGLMARPHRLDALEAGIHFMTWVLSDHSISEPKPERFFGSLGMSWDEVARQCRHGDKAIAAFLESFERGLPEERAYVFPWFELGRRTVFIADLAGTGAPPEIHEQAMAGYHSLLENSGIDASEREQLEALVADVAEGMLEDEEYKLQRILGRLRSKAAEMSPTPAEPNVWNARWARGVLTFFTALVIVSSLLASQQRISFVALLMVIAGSALGVGLIGAIQLQEDEEFRGQPLLELMGLSFTHLPLIRRRSSGSQGS